MLSDSLASFAVIISALLITIDSILTIMESSPNTLNKEKKVNHINIQFETNSCLSKSMLCGDKL